MLGYFTRRRRARSRMEPFPPAWRGIIEQNVTLFRHLPPDDQRELLGHVRVFLAEKRFEGCAALELTDEIRVTIAAQACILLLRRPTDYYPRVRTILVYPGAYLAPDARDLGGGPRLGHTPPREDALVLAWDAVHRGATNPHDGDNLVLHEFAHALDEEDGATDGAPVLDTPQRYMSWARVLGEEYSRLCHARESQARTLLNQYGATNPAEFFAVATEFFFERPRALRAWHPRLYAELRSYYRQDPAAYVEPAPDPSPIVR